VREKNSYNDHGSRHINIEPLRGQKNTEARDVIRIQHRPRILRPKAPP
jgi:hypothetical protein